MQFALGFAAALVFVSLIALLRIRRWGRFRRGAFAVSPAVEGRRWPFRRLFSRLETSPAQEQVLIDEAAALRQDLAALRNEWTSLREELASLLGEPSRLEAAFASRDERLSALRRRLAGAVARFHAVLDEAQRRALASMVREGHLLAAARAQRRC